jgi:hypothetical protein
LRSNPTLTRYTISSSSSTSNTLLAMANFSHSSPDVYM